MQDYEKLGVFYLGKEYDLETRKPKDEMILYDSKDLVTHAVVVGMTGSGKTGLCVGLIEEAAIDGVPSILIDPKGDLSNLLLTFPELRTEDFLPWINEDDARQKGLTPEAYAEKQAQTWKSGLESWGQSGERIRTLKNAAEYAIYTPMSNAGIPVSILKSFAAPPQDLIDDTEMMRERVSSTVTSLLSLVGIDADPVQSREFILLTTIIDRVWRDGQDLDLAQLITQVQNPPVTKIGVLDLDTFYPAKERFALVMALNNLIASPGFNSWLEGVPLDIGQILYTPAGKPRVAIFSIAHLSDPQRMFFVTLLLNQVLGWMRAQSGTTSLRAILYMDEIFGYLPPLSNPPSKMPMLTLLKQARAFGLGLVLATQNPVDLDYKALSNAGTWFIGRLQTERDKARVLDGLEGASTSAGAQFDRQDIERVLSGLGSRVFLMNNTHEDAPVVMTTRWAMSYLRGPLTREQIRTLMAPMKAASCTAAAAACCGQTRPSRQLAAAAAVTQPTAVAAATSAAPRAAAPRWASQLCRPMCSSISSRRAGVPRQAAAWCIMPRVLGSARISFADAKTRASAVKQAQYLAEITDSVIAVDWAQASAVDLAISDLEKRADASAAAFGDLPPLASKAKSYTAWNKEFVTWLYGSQTLDLLQSPSLRVVSKPGEEERDFRIRLAQDAREKRDEAVDALRAKYTPKLATLQERKRKAQQAVDREKEQARSQGVQAALSIGATILGAFTGRKIKSSVSSASSAFGKVGRAANQRGDVGRAEDTVESIDKQIQEMDAEFKAQAEELAAKIDPATEELAIVAIRPKKTDIIVQMVALAWAPYWQSEQGIFQEGW